MAENEFNIFEAIGATRQEVRHSDFLAFLLNPKESHNLGDKFLKSFICIILNNSDEFKKIDFNDAEVFREQSRIDILIVFENSKHVLAIENKIDSEEHGNQLSNYQSYVNSEYENYTQIFIYLTPDNRPTIGKEDGYNWSLISYAVVSSVVQNLLNTTNLEIDLKIVLEHYIKMLNKHVLVKVNLTEYLRGLIKTTPSEFHLSVTHPPFGFFGDRIGFMPHEWENAHLAYFYFYVENPAKYGVELYLHVAPSSDPTRNSQREKLFEIIRDNPNPLKVARGNQAKWIAIYSESYLSRDEIINKSLDQNQMKIKEKWEIFCHKTLNQILAIINPILLGK